MSTVEFYKTILAQHIRNDWSDGTVACGGCRDQVEKAETRRLKALGDKVTREDLIASHNYLYTFIKPNWTLDDYNQHVAEVIVSVETENSTY